MSKPATSPAGAVLEDLLESDLRVVFCGTAAGRASAEAACYYAGKGNQFWETLHTTGLTPRQLAPAEFRTLSSYGIGLTDVCKRAAGSDRGLASKDYDVKGFWERIGGCRPTALAFNGKQAAKIALEQVTVNYGAQPSRTGLPQLFVLPSTSGAARGYWDPQYWLEFAKSLHT